jgi:hypothetical protein
LDLLGAQIDSVAVESVPTDVQFDLAIRLVGTVQDFQEPHELRVVLSDPQLVPRGMLAVPIESRLPTTAHIPGYELNHHVPVRIDFEPDEFGGHDLSFALDGQPAHPQKTTLSVVAGA